MTISPTASHQQSDRLSALCLQLTTGSEKLQQQAIVQLADFGNDGEQALMEFLQQRQTNYPTWVDGSAYQVIARSNSPEAKKYLQTNFPHGLVALKSESDIDYTPLQKLLISQDFQAADTLTLRLLCQLAGASAIQRKWLYFTEVDNFPIADLHTINTLWLIFSEGKFGFSVQRQLWLSSGKNWEKLWVQIGWKDGNNWTRYPNEFTWNLTAPIGHLPLSNQLRGVRAISSLLSHSAWNSPAKN
ncbi:GUN4 domain-containing protein [Synechocystis sp. PCC 7509]|uniref:GUN4 domain-containing protein n=1 Tax=Synechocystis sp. PCC 7509 TaxID=927677 RepID=UPI0002AC4FE2|nr:GUN4 domain-containing protein [Synechocystis sp. PCC 7509]